MDVSFPEDLQDLLKICFLEQPAAACHLPHTHAKASGLSYCSIFLCFVFFCFFFPPLFKVVLILDLLLQFSELLLHTPAISDSFPPVDFRYCDISGTPQ